MGTSAKLDRWEEKLWGLLWKIDHTLEARHGSVAPRHPSRPPHGIAANPQYDGLFRVTTAFSAGYGSELGPGYIVQVEIVTLARVPSKTREAIEAEAEHMLREGLPEAFPGRALRVARDGAVLKIVGDLSLD